MKHEKLFFARYDFYILAIFDYPPGKVKRDKDFFQDASIKNEASPHLMNF
jgi:hypothetical protein